MNRREFIAVGMIAGTATSIKGSDSKILSASNSVRPKHQFRLKYAPHLGMFKHHAGTDDPDRANMMKDLQSKTDKDSQTRFTTIMVEDYIKELRFAASQGFMAWEDNGMRNRPREAQEAIAAEMKSLGMEMGVFVANDNGLAKPILTSGDIALRDAFLENIRQSVEVAKRVNTKYVTLVVGNETHNLQQGYQTANVIDTLKRAAAICEPSGLIMVCEPLNIYRDHPQFFVSSNAQMYALMKAVNSPSCKLLFDVYHTQVNEGNIIPNMDRCWDEVAYIQTGDHPGRKEPTTGEINYKNVFRHIQSKGYKGIVGMEHGISKNGKEGEEALINAYITCDES
jgi:hydroxypyruvate isomerase